MALSITDINVGAAADDGTGDTARVAFTAVNTNFDTIQTDVLLVDGSNALTGDLVFTEKADHTETPIAGKGYLWVKSDTPSSLIFTDDAGTDYDLTNVAAASVEGTSVLSTGEVGGTKFLREDGDNTSSWQGITEAVITDLGTTVAMVADNLSVFAATTSAQLAGVISDETGTGALVFANSPTLVTPALGTPASGNLSNCTAYEGTAVASTGEAGGTKFLREDGDGTCSWQIAVTALVDDTTPQLGGPLDVNGQEIQSSGDITLQLGDAAGSNKFIIQDSASDEQATIDSDGTITANLLLFGENWQLDTDGVDAFNDFTFQLGADVSSGDVFSFKGAAAGELTASSGTQAFMSIQPNINQSGTGIYRGVEIDVTETATGGGDNYFAWWGLGGVKYGGLSHVSTTAVVQCGSATAGAETWYVSQVSSGLVKFAAGPNADSGANLVLYGATHATKTYDIHLRTSSTDELVFDNSENSWDFQLNEIRTGGDITLEEKADHTATPAAGLGYLWVRNDAPNSVMFTDDAGTDHKLNSVPQFKSSTYTAVDGDEVYVDCSGGAVTINLPASPATNTRVKVIDSSGDSATYNITVGRNSETIDGAAADFTIDLAYGGCAFAYNGSDWKIFPMNGV